MDDAGEGQIARNERRESQDSGKMGRRGGAMRRARSGAWPAEVSSGTHGVFTSYRTLTGLRALGLKVAQIRFEVRSRKGAGVWVMARGLGNPIANGRILSEATAALALIRLLVPEVEEIHDQQGNRLA